VIKLGTIAKLAGLKMAAPGSITLDELMEMVAELAASLGMAALSVEPVPSPDGAEEAFHRAAGATFKADAKIFRLHGKMKSGDALEGLMILVPAQAIEK
jgi:hypothetical protein